MSSDRRRVFVTREIPAAGLDHVLATCDADVWPEHLPPSRDVLLNRVAGCEGILSLLTEKIDAEVMDAAGSQLKVISNFAVGFNNIDIAEATRRRIRVGNTPGVLTDATADLAVALLLAAGRRIPESQDYVRQGNWNTWEPLGHIGVDLLGKTIGIVGMGRIGMATARRLHGGWGMRVIYNSRTRKPAAEEEFAAEKVEIDTLLAESDFVSVHVDLNETTKQMFNREAFQKMKPTAIFVNTARGPIHHQADLYDALSTGEIFAAALDVTDPEPISMDDRLLQLRNCVIAPHIGSGTVSSRNGMAEIAAENLIRGLQGKPLLHWVNPE